MIVVAIIGAVVNAASALLFMSGRKQDLNRRSAFVHLAADAVLAVGVAIAGALILVTGWLWLDPAVSIALALTIWRAPGLCSESRSTSCSTPSRRGSIRSR